MEHPRSVPTDEVQGRNHYTTITEEDWAHLSFERCFFFARKYGVSGSKVWEQIRSGDTSNRTFCIKHPVPHLLSKEELLGDIKALKRIACERKLHWKPIYMWRFKARHSSAGSRSVVETSDRELESCEVPPALPEDSINDALSRFYDTRTTACFGLHLLVTIQNEDAAAAGHDAGVRSLLRRQPMSVLHNFIAELWQVREAWERQLLVPSATAVAEEQARTKDEELNALLFHICLWQRRYPLPLLLSVLSFHAEHRGAFYPATSAEPCETYQLEQLLEELQRLHYPDLSDVPGLIRCDVLMTYPKMPVEEQAALMRHVAAAAQRRVAAAAVDPLTHDNEEEEEEGNARDALRCHSRTAPDPRLLLAGFVPSSLPIPPPRFCSGMSRDVYRDVRAAFECHKHDGVRRLAAQDYEAPFRSSAAACDGRHSAHRRSRSYSD
ncbi:hypothetical protein N2W54_003661 [Lotmaria passim]